MPLIDSDEARQVVTRFLGLLRDIQSPRKAWEGWFTDPSEEPPPVNLWSTFAEYEAWLNKEAIGLQPLMEDIAREIDPSGNSYRFGKDLINGWETAKEGSLRILGILDNAAVRERLLGPKGPVLVAGGLHRWVWNAAADLWDGGYYNQAVHAAWKAVEQQTQLKIDRADLSGKDLYAQAFSINKTQNSRRLRFDHIGQVTKDGKTIPDWKSAHQGAMHFGMGCAQGIRNLQVHSMEALDEQKALEYLAALSVLARWVESADVRSSSS